MARQGDSFDFRRTTGRIMATGVVAVALCFAVGIGSAAAAVLSPFAIDFDHDGTGTPIAPGTFTTNEWESLGVTVSSPSGGALRLFDANCGGGPASNCTGGDTDLFAPGQGNVLIIDNSGNPAIPPNDSGAGGTIRFDFAMPANLSSITLLDNDNGSGGIGIVLNLFTADLFTPSAIIETALVADGEMQNIAFGLAGLGLMRLDVVLPGSGAIAALTAMPVPAALPLLLSALAWLGWIARRRQPATA